jgi:prevent-host-death family protein
MIDIRPISDLRNNFAEIEKKVNNSDKPIIFTKNGRGSMVLMSLDRFSKVASAEYIEQALDEADQYAEHHPEDLTHEDIFSKIRTKING